MAGEGFNDDEDDQNQRTDPMRSPFSFTVKDPPQDKRVRGRNNKGAFSVGVTNMGRRNNKLAPIKTHSSMKKV